jgi:flagella basal body P-ring formation protein FlgA
MMPPAAFAIAGCLAVAAGSDHITFRDLAPAFPGVTAVAPDTPVALAPSPGVQRVWRGAELLQLAARLNVSPPNGAEVCVERPVAVLDSARMLEAMRRNLPAGTIEILDFSRVPAPQGELEFPLSGLRQTPGGGVWNGAVRYAGNRRFVVWAKVNISVWLPRVVAITDLKPGRPVAATDLRLETHEEFPTSAYVASIEDAAGRVLRRPVAAGSPLLPQWLDAPSDVARGEIVRVDVWNGGAHLEFEAEAEASGGRGQTIPVMNPISKKRFMARVDGKSRVSVGSAPR